MNGHQFHLGLQNGGEVCRCVFGPFTPLEVCSHLKVPNPLNPCGILYDWRMTWKTRDIEWYHPSTTFVRELWTLGGPFKTKQLVSMLNASL